MMWFLAWLIALEALSLAVLPLTVRLLRPLPDRGVLFAKPLGLLLVGYVCWLPGVMGLLRHQQATVAAAAVAVGAVCWYRWGHDTVKQLSGIRALIVASEAVFLVSLAGAALVRAHTPEISGTEKPMDFAILNAIVRGESLPPEDPWLSGYSISYYYFGYYLLATLGKLSGVPASVAYNLGVASVFALLLAGSFSLAFNLLSALRPGSNLTGRILGALLAPVVVGLMGNLEIGLEVLAAQGYSNPAFWQWVGVKNLQPAAQPEGLFPSDHWWWWRASRIIPTTKPDGINEFPYFSFLLGDLHPHYSALPWGLLAIAAAMALLLSRAASESRPVDWTWRLGIGALLGFLLVGNSWDFPTYTGLVWLAALVPLRPGEWGRWPLLSRAREPLQITVLAPVLYLPFFLGFSSQTKGLALSEDRTPLASLLIIFGPVLLALTLFLAWRAMRAGKQEVFQERAWRVSAAIGLALVLGSPLLGSLGVLFGVLLLSLAALGRAVGTTDEPNRQRSAVVFHLLLCAAGIGIVLAPEFVFLVDLFGTRMNTVFKFHYQAWVIMGLAASVGAVWMLAEVRPKGKIALAVPLALLVGIGLVYPFAATPSKTQDFEIQPTLDGAVFYRSLRPDDFAAIGWLMRAGTGRPVVLEATGGAYSEFARVSTFSGLPTVLGWGGHEAQWGRRGEELAARARDIDALYSTAAKESVLPLLAKYRVQYVFVGSLEIDRYGASVTQRFDGLLEPVFRQGTVSVYRVPSRGVGVVGTNAGN